VRREALALLSSALLGSIAPKTIAHEYERRAPRGGAKARPHPPWVGIARCVSRQRASRRVTPLPSASIATVRPGGQVGPPALPASASKPPQNTKLHRFVSCWAYPGSRGIQQNLAIQPVGIRANETQRCKLSYVLRLRYCLPWPPLSGPPSFLGDHPTHGLPSRFTSKGPCQRPAVRGFPRPRRGTVRRRVAPCEPLFCMTRC